MFENYSRITNSLVDLVNSQRGLNRRTRNALVPGELRKAFKDGAKLAVELGLVIDTLSEMSARLSGGKMMATTAEAIFTRLEEEYVGIFSMTTNVALEQKDPPCHFAWHQRLYANEDIQAVFYCQSPAIISVVNANTLPDARILSDAKELIREAVFVEPDVEAIGNAFDKASMLLIPQHGLLTWGEDVYQAIVKAEFMNRVCEVEVITRQSGM